MPSLASIDIGGIIEGAGKALDGLFTSNEERMKARAVLLEVENKLTASVLDYEKTVTSAQRDIILAEAQSGSWMAKNWRPLLMLSITFILVHKYILFPYLSSWLEVPDLLLPEKLFTLLTVGVGGYVVGRSGEKIAQTLKATKSVNLETPKDLRLKRKLMKTMKKLGMDEDD